MPLLALGAWPQAVYDAYPYALTDRQRDLFNYLGNLWRVTPVAGGRGRTLYVLERANVPYFRDPFVDPGDVKEFARSHRDFFRGHEELHFAELQPVEQDWILVDVTIRDGVPANCYGRVWKVTGPPQHTTAAPEREAGNVTVSGTMQETWPEEIVVPAAP